MNEIGTSGNSRQAYVTNDVTVGRSLFCLAFFVTMKCLCFSRNACILKLHCCQIALVRAASVNVSLTVFSTFSIAELQFYACTQKLMHNAHAQPHLFLQLNLYSYFFGANRQTVKQFCTVSLLRYFQQYCSPGHSCKCLCSRVRMYLVLFRSDADPDVLAKYVMALVKKDKPVSELIATCQNQLDIFLQKSKHISFVIRFVLLLM